MRSLNTSLLNKKQMSLKTFGNSMYPLLHDGDVVYLKKTAFSRLRINDIVCVKKYGVLQTHRIIYKTPKYVITKGDNNLKADGRVYERQIVGRVYQVKRDGQVFDPEEIYLIQSTLYFQEIVKIKKAFEKAGIDFVFLKGLPVHLYYEKKHPRRLYSDCDVLVAKKDFIASQKILNKYKYSAGEKSLSLLHKTLRRTETQMSYYKPVGTFPVIFDIHCEAVFTIPQLGSLDAIYPNKLITSISKDLLDQKKNVKILGEDFPILQTDDQLLFLCHNFFRDNFSRSPKLNLLHTVAQHVLTKETYGKQLVYKTNKYKLENIIHPALQLLGIYYPDLRYNKILDLIRPTNAALQYIKRNIYSQQAVATESRISTGVMRFKNQFYLSPQPLRKRILVFFQPNVLYSIIWSISKICLTKIRIRTRLKMSIG